jgi:hypothetical protein
MGVSGQTTWRVWEPQVTLVISRTSYGADTLVRPALTKQKATREVALLDFLVTGFLPNYLEIGPAAVIHPNTAAVVAPAVALPAGRVAALLQELYAAASGVSRAVVAVHIVGRARDELVLPAATLVAIAVPVAVPTTIPASPDRKISPATVVNPDTSIVRAPAVTFAARRLATLLHQANPPTRISRAIVAVAIV